MENNETTSILATVRLFRGLSRHDLELLASLAETTPFATGETLIAEGEVRPTFQIVVEGTVRVELPTETPHTRVKRREPVVLNRLGRGSCFGEYSLLDEMPASASVVAESDGVALLVSHSDLQNLLASDDRVARVVYHNMLVELVGRLKRRETTLDRSLML